MFQKVTKMMLVLAVLFLPLAACGQKATPTTDPSTVYTQVAATVQAEFTQNAALTPSLEPTATQEPTATLEPTLEFTATLEFSPTPPTPIATWTSTAVSAMDQAILISESPQDNALIAPNATFTKTWKIRNIGYSTWTKDFGLYFKVGNQMGGTSPLKLTKEVKPLEDYEFTLTFKAPKDIGKVRGDWELRNASGVTFYSVFVLIDVSNSAIPTATITPTSPPATATSPAPTATNTSEPPTETPTTSP